MREKRTIFAVGREEILVVVFSGRDSVDVTESTEHGIGGVTVCPALGVRVGSKGATRSKIQEWWPQGSPIEE
jgi:hypothetical protein